LGAAPCNPIAGPLIAPLVKDPPPNSPRELKREGPPGKAPGLIGPNIGGLLNGGMMSHLLSLNVYLLILLYDRRAGESAATNKNRL